MTSRRSTGSGTRALSQLFTVPVAKAVKGNSNAAIKHTLEREARRACTYDFADKETRGNSVVHQLRIGIKCFISSTFYLFNLACLDETK